MTRPTKRVGPDFWLEQYKLIETLGPLPWQESARQLVYSANLLRARDKLFSYDVIVEGMKSPHPNYGQVCVFHALMLYGLALENLLKGLLVARGAPSTRTGSLDKNLRTHDLDRLFRQAMYSPSAAESRLLKRLQHHVENAKYPHGLRPRDLGADVPNIDSDIRATFQLLEKVEQALQGRKWHLPPIDLRTLGERLLP